MTQRLSPAGSVSVVIPSYNTERYLALALDSVARQSLVPAELIVVDDGSKDASVEIARRHGATVLKTEVNGGPSAARNLGWARSTGDFIAFLDADDEWETRHLEILVQAAMETGASVVSSISPSSSRRLGATAGQCVALALEDLLEYNPICQSGVLMARAFIPPTLRYEPSRRHAEDYDLWVRMLLAGIPIAGVSDWTVRRREHDGQASRATARMIKGAWKTRNFALDQTKRETSSSPEQWRRMLRAARMAHRDDLLQAVYHADRETLGVLSEIAAQRAEFESERALAHLLSKLWPLFRARALVRRVVTRTAT